MKNEYFAFLEAYNEVAQISPEHLPDFPTEESNGLCKDNFYETLHVRRNISDLILNDLLTSRDQLIFFVGPRGSGKSTAGIKTIKTLKEYGFYTLFFSIAKHEANRYLDDRRKVMKYLRDYIYNDMKRTLFNLSDDPTAAKGRFIAYLLSEDVSHENRPDVFNTVFIDFQWKLKEFMHAPKLKFEEAANWLSNGKYVFHQEVINFCNELMEKVELTHLSHAIKYFKKSVGQIIWIDNVDAFEQQAQNELINAIFSISASEPENIRFVVAAREENVLRFDSFYEPQGSIRRSAVYINDSNPNHTMPGLHMPALPLEHLAEIVTLRLEFTRKFQRDKEQEARTILNTPESSKLQRRRATFLLDKYSPFISDKRLRVVQQLSDNILKVFGNERVLHLANNNIRLLLPFHCAFLKYLFELDKEEKDVPTAFEFDESFLKTLLLYWIVNSQNATGNEFRLFNIIQHSRDCDNRTPNSMGCFTPFVTLSCIWNLCVKNRRVQSNTFSFPTVKEVEDRLHAVMGFSRKDIRETILRLYDPRSELTMFIAIESRDRLENIDQLRDDHRVRISYKGRATLASLCNSFGFLYAIMKISDGFAAAYIDEKRLSKYFLQLLPELVCIAEVHLESLNIIRQNNYFKNTKTWLDDYIDMFGIPLEPKFSRTQKGSRPYGTNPRKVLYFDSLINSIESYSKESRNLSFRKTIKELINEFCRILSQVEKGEIPPGERIKIELKMLPTK
jgi:hypothetical protein